MGPNPWVQINTYIFVGFSDLRNPLFLFLMCLISWRMTGLSQI